jgi:ribosomal protein S18 acetylase RimI-like enzyme
VSEDLEIQSARSLPPAGRAELFNAAYEGYLVPFHVDVAALEFMDDAFDLDLDASRIAYSDGKPVGLANLGVRGEDAWIGGVGVVTSARRSGIGGALMLALHEQARERDVRRVWLEVIVENTGAFALYEKLGYRTVRDVEVWSLPAGEEDTEAAREVPVGEAQERIRELGGARAPWQRADETIANYGDARGLSTDAGAAVFRTGAAVQLIQVAGEVEPFLRFLRGLGAVSVLNLPEDDPAAPTLHSLGATAVIRQHEMLLDLEN